jgi:protein phosphatase
VLGVAIVVVLAAVIGGATLWVRHQYYVADHGGVVAIFRGVNGSLLGWHFSSFKEDSCHGKSGCRPVKVTDLQPAAQSQVQAGIRATSLGDARDVLHRLENQMLPVCPETTGPSGAASTSSRTGPPRTQATAPTTRATPAAPTAHTTGAAGAGPNDRAGTLATGMGAGPRPAVTVTQTVTATPLAPAAAVPGVTCRTVP